SSGVVKTRWCPWSAGNSTKSLSPARVWPCSMPVVIVHSLNSHKRLPMWYGRFSAKCCAQLITPPGAAHDNYPRHPGKMYCSPQVTPVWRGATKKEASMQVYYFTELPYHEYPDEEGAKYPSLRLTFPNTYYNPHKTHDLFNRYLDEYQYC